MKNDARFFGELTKFEPLSDGSIKVYGVASSPIRDSAGEIVTPGAMSKAIGEYSKYPAIREMHRSDVAAGRALEIYLDDDDRTQLVAHVVDKEAIKKVKAKVYGGWSIGGKIKKRRYNDPSVIEEIELQEISLVDRPCNQEAAITLWKKEGTMPTDNELNKASDDGSNMQDFKDRGRWDDGFDGGGDAGTKSGPTSVTDGQSGRQDASGTPQADRGGSQKDFLDNGEWYDREFGGGGDAGTGNWTADPNAGQVRDADRPNATTNSGRTGGRDGAMPTDGGGADHTFSGIPGATFPGVGAAAARNDDIDGTDGDSNSKEYFQPLPGSMNKRTFTAEQRHAAAKSGAAMKDGSFPIETRGDLKNAMQAIGRAHPDKRAAVRAHIHKRAAALGVKLPDSWGAEKSEKSSSIHDTLAIIQRADDALKGSFEAIEKLEIKARRGNATDESIRLAKHYKAMTEEELAEVLASTEKASQTQQIEHLAKMKTNFEAIVEERGELVKKVNELTDGMAELRVRLQKLYDTPMPGRSAGSSFVSSVSKAEDTQGASKSIQLTAEERELAKKAWNEMSEEDQVFYLTKHSLSNGRLLNIAPVPNPPKSIGGAAGRS